MKAKTVKSALHCLIPALFLCSVGLQAQERSFTIAVIPDTQNYVDYTLQKSNGFALDGVDIFMAQMQYIAGRTRANGGDIDFVASVGDVWQHVVRDSDPEHNDRGLAPDFIHPAATRFVNAGQTEGFEIPHAVEGYELIAATGVPFGVAPGNHDYDAWWGVRREAPGTNGQTGSQEYLHIGGLENFRRVFGSSSDFFRNKPWYVSGYNGGTSSAQLFEAGGYRFLHLAFEMQAGDEVLEWAQGVLDAHPGVPAIISTHDYLNAAGERKTAGAMDLAAVDPGFNNSAEDIWQRFISQNDQVFLVLCGHQIGQALRTDENVHGNQVYQMLADYQQRGQAGLDAGQPLDPEGDATGLGDGWYRELTFVFDEQEPRLQVRTYSTHYNSYSGELDTYVDWYRHVEQPQMSDAMFLQADDFTIQLGDFYERFGHPE